MLKLDEQDLDLINKLDSNASLTVQDKLALKDNLRTLEQRLFSYEQRLQAQSASLSEKMDISAPVICALMSVMRRLKNSPSALMKKNKRSSH